MQEYPQRKFSGSQPPWNSQRFLVRWNHEMANPQRMNIFPARMGEILQGIALGGEK